MVPTLHLTWLAGHVGRRTARSTWVLLGRRQIRDKLSSPFFQLSVFSWSVLCQVFASQDKTDGDPFCKVAVDLWTVEQSDATGMRRTLCTLWARHSPGVRFETGNVVQIYIQVFFSRFARRHHPPPAAVSASVVFDLQQCLHSHSIPVPERHGFHMRSYHKHIKAQRCAHEQRKFARASSNSRKDKAARGKGEVAECTVQSPTEC